jgi:hypothetical protein
VRLRVFPLEEEGRLHLLTLARAWRRSRLVGEEDLRAFEAEAGEPLRCAGLAVRILFFALALVAVAAVNVLIAEFVEGQPLQGAWIALTGVVCWVLGELLLARYRLYRFGVEEGLLSSGASQIAFGLVLALGPAIPHTPRAVTLSFSLPVCAAFLLLYLRVGYVYAAFVSIGAAAFALFTAGPGEHAARLIWAGGSLAVVALMRARREIPEHEREAWDMLQGALALSAYLVLNLRLAHILSFGRPAPRAGSLYEWATLAAVGLLPPLLLASALSRRSRAFLAAGSIAALLSLVTLKPYLGLQRHVWDAALLGAFLMALSVFLRRRLDAGPAGERGGWTARELVVPKDEGLAPGQFLAAAVGVAAAQPGPAPAERPGFGGGSSGGGGASAGF